MRRAFAGRIVAFGVRYRFDELVRLAAGDDVRTEMRPAVSINGEYITHGEVESLRCAVTALHSEMSGPDALGTDEHGRFMAKHYRRDMERILRLMGVIG